MKSRPMSSAVAGLFLLQICSQAVAMDVYELTMLGRELATEDVATLEEHVSANPDDVESRTKLLGFYFGKGFRDRSARDAKQRHVLWLIENAPESEVLSLPYGQLDAILDADAYAQGKKFWLDHCETQPENLKLLGNSSAYFLHHDRDLAIASLERARILDPKNPKWPADLGKLYALGMMRAPNERRVEIARQALEQLEIAYDLSTEDARDPLLDQLAKTAFEAGEIEKAKRYAEQMLNQNVGGWNHGNNVHHGNLILGRIALAAGDLNQAKQRLIDAGKTPGSPQLNSFGPNMALAKDLLQKGEKDVVLEYFAMCSKFWERGDAKIERWSAVVKEDKVPDFGAHLSY